MPSAAALLRATFVAAFERCFGRVYVYVGKRAHDRASLERIVDEVLAANLDLLIDRHDEVEEVLRLMRCANRRVALEAASRIRSHAIGT